MSAHPERPAGEMAVAHLDGCGCPECEPPDPAIAARERAAAQYRDAWGEDNPALFTGHPMYEK